MYYGVEFSVTRDTEIFDAWFDFARDFRPGDESDIVSAVFSLEVLETERGYTEDTSPNSHLSGGALVEASEVSGRDTVAVQRIDTLVEGNKYLVTCLATMDNGAKLSAESRVWCKQAT